MSRSDSSRPPETWPIAERAARALVNPLQRFIAIEASSGILLVIAVAVAMIWANTDAHSYEAVWHLPFGVRLGDWSVSQSLHFLINDGLMTIFFFVVGLEIRREMYEGELSDVRRAALPVAAALGGVAIPALIFIAFNHGRAGAAGWAIPTATDIAFAVGVLTLLGSRVPPQLRILLLGLAVIDDIAAIVVIAIFYSSGVSLHGFGFVIGGLAVVYAMRATGVRRATLYILPGAAVWFGLLEAGIHPTLSGVILGLVTPVRPWFGPSGFAATTQSHLQHLDEQDRHVLLERLGEIEHARREAVSPTERLIHGLHPWVAFGVMPVFALANAGVVIHVGDLQGDGLWLFLGIVLGLAVGKPLGITVAALVSTRVGIAARSAELWTGGVTLVGIVGGIGFTMSLFIANLAFPKGALLEAAKLGIVAGSAVAMVVGLIYGAITIRNRPPPA
jgi:Na+:H+ antiporter, NhaA family